MTIWHCLPCCLRSGSCILCSTRSGLSGRLQAPFLSDTCSSVPVAGVCSPVGTVLGLWALRHPHTQRARHAWDMVTWTPPPSSSTLSLTDLCGVGRPTPCLSQDISEAWLTLQRAPPTPAQASGGRCPRGLLPEIASLPGFLLYPPCILQAPAAPSNSPYSCTALTQASWLQGLLGSRAETAVLWLCPLPSGSLPCSG